MRVLKRVDLSLSMKFVEMNRENQCNDFNDRKTRSNDRG